MKLKEKLAQEWWHQQWEDKKHLAKANFAMVDTYLAGFEKAREMASEEADNNCSDKEDNEYNAACWEISVIIQGLGEEEVE